jgi:hypothetical protein
MPLIKARSSSIMNDVALRGQPTAPTAQQNVNTTQLASTAYVRTAIADLIDSSPALLNTLNELAQAINSDPSFATTVANSIATKVPLDGSVAMTGELTLSGDPSGNLGAVTKQYVDNAINAQMIYSTDDVPEGTNNLYYTNARVFSAVTLSSDNTSVLDYDSTTGTFTYNHPNSDGILEGTTNLYYTNSRVRNAISLTSDDGQILSYSSSTGAFTFTTPNTDKITEGATNLYFTTARARNSVSNGSNINYDSSTGVISTQAAVWSVNGQNHTVVLDTDDISEGSTNLYFTNARAAGAVSLTTDDSNVLSYNSGTGVFTFAKPNTDAINEGSINLYFTNSRARQAISVSSSWGNISYDNTSGVITVNAPDTDDVNEGSNNKYYTDARARNAVSLTTDNASVFDYDNTTGIFTFTIANQTTDDVAEGQNNLYFTTARARNSISTTGWQISYNSGTGVISVATPDTDDVAEGATNQYFTTARARNSVSATDAGGDGSFSYDSTTGAFTYTGPSASEARAHFSATDAGGDGSFSYDSTTGAFTYTGPSASETRAHFNATQPAGDGSLSYDNTTGVFTYTGPDDADYRQAVSANHASGDGNLQYNSTTGVFTYDGPTNTDYRGAVSATDAGGDGSFSYNSTTGVFTYTGPSASEARAHFSATDAGGDGSFSYDSTTGTFTYTGPSSSEVRAHFSATSATGIGYNSSTGVFSLSSIPNSSLSNSDVTINGTTVSLGGSGSFDTDSVNEGSNNLYYTTARTRADVSASDTQNVGAFSYSSATGVFSFDASNVVATVNGYRGTVTLDTDDIAEGPSATLTTSGLYFTTARARNSVSAGTGVSYNSTTGVISIGQAVGTTDNVTFNDVTVSGDLTVNGTLTTINSTTVTVADKNITIADGAPNAAAANGAGITVDGANATITYTSANDRWEFNKDVYVNGDFETTGSLTAAGFVGPLTGNVTGTVSDISNHTTDALAEGSNNLYFTNTRARSAVSLTSDKTSVLDYNSGTGVFTFTLANASTTDIAEGTNLYYTTARTRADVSANDAGGDGSFSYDSTTGTFTYTGPSASETRAHFSAGTSGTGYGSLSYDNTTGAFTFAKVTSANIRGELGANKASGDGNFSYDSTTGVFTYTGPDDADYRTAVSATKVSGDGNFSYDNTTGVFSYTGPSASETRAHFSAGTSGTGYGNLQYNSTTGVFTLTKVSAADIRSEVSAVDAGGDGSFSYDSTTGAFTYTGPSDSEVRAHFSATTATGAQYDSATGVFSLANIPNSSLTNDSVTVNGATVALGASITLDTDDVGEGTSNLYFTQARARTAVSLTSDDSTVLDYDNTTGTFTFVLANVDTDKVAEGSTNLYYTDARARNSISVSGWQISYNSSTGVISIATPDTDDVSEGTSNLYFTQARARNAVSLTTDDSSVLAYNSTTGTFTFTLANTNTDKVAEGSNNLYFTTARARNSVSNGSNINYDSSTGVISTQAAVWSVNGQNHTVVLDTDDISEGSTNLYFTNARARSAITLTTDNSQILDYDTGTGVFTWNTPTTDAISEGTNNLYYTDNRADARIAAASIRDLSDVNKTESLQDGYTLVWSSAQGEFVPQNVAVTATTLNFSGDGTTTTFSTGVNVTSIDNTQVFINGLIQAPTYSYTISTVSNVTSIVFDTAPEANDYIFVRVTATSSLTAGGVLNESSQIDGGTY